MQAAARSCLTTGVALVGAGAIAVSPLAPPAPALLKAENPAVTLSAINNPIPIFAPVFQKALTDFVQLSVDIIQRPVPIIGAVGANAFVDISTLGTLGFTLGENVINGLFTDVPARLQQVFQQFANGQISDALVGLATLPLVPFENPQNVTLVTAAFTILAQPFINIADVIQAAPEIITRDVVEPVTVAAVNIVGAFGNAIEGLAAANTFDDFINAGIQGSANITASLLAPITESDTNNGGIIAGLQALREDIADTLRNGPQVPTFSAPSSANSTLSPATKAVTLKVAPQPVAPDSSEQVRKGLVATPQTGAGGTGGSSTSATTRSPLGSVQQVTKAVRQATGLKGGAKASTSSGGAGGHKTHSRAHHHNSN